MNRVCDISSSGIPWQPASIDATTPLHALLDQLTVSNTSHILYNDQPPWFDGQVNPSYIRFLAYAHSKGVLHWNSTHGFWLQHSVPHWPNVTNVTSGGTEDVGGIDEGTDWKYIPTAQTRNGQHFLCMSLTIVVINTTAGALLNTIRPAVYQVEGV